jgi:hypothetical protein
MPACSVQERRLDDAFALGGTPGKDEAVDGQQSCGDLELVLLHHRVHTLAGQCGKAEACRQVCRLQHRTRNHGHAIGTRVLVQAAGEPPHPASAHWRIAATCMQCSSAEATPAPTAECAAVILNAVRRSAGVP